MTNYKATIAHAVVSELGTIHGQPGNQTYNPDHTSGELRFSDWYKPSDGWTYVIRPKSDIVAIAIAEAMIGAVKNPLIGYSQEDRYSLYDAVNTSQFDTWECKKKCNCDCSSLVTVAANHAGIPILRGTYTGNMKDRYKATGLFKILTKDKYISFQDRLYAGDILLRENHHTAVVVNGIWHLCRELQRGSFGLSVKALQQRLNELHLDVDPLVIDGDFGPRTELAVRIFQRDHDLKKDGIVGVMTATELGMLWR